jgi:hypothetical protein
MFHVEQLVIILGAILTLLVIYLFNFKYLVIQPLMERLFLLKPLHSIFNLYPLEGLGSGQFVYKMQGFFDEKLLTWQFQPIHNVYLLILSELGLVGLALFLWFLVYVLMYSRESVPRETSRIPEVTDTDKRSTWNKLFSQARNMFHVELSMNVSARVNESLINNDSLYRVLVKILLVCVLAIMFFDHYFWDIQQGRLLFWIVLALVMSHRGSCVINGTIDK